MHGPLLSRVVACCGRSGIHIVPPRRSITIFVGIVVFRLCSSSSAVAAGRTKTTTTAGLLLRGGDEPLLMQTKKTGRDGGTRRLLFFWCSFSHRPAVVILPLLVFLPPTSARCLTPHLASPRARTASIAWLSLDGGALSCSAQASCLRC